MRRLRLSLRLRLRPRLRLRLRLRLRRRKKKASKPVSLLLHDVAGAASGGGRVPGPPSRRGRAQNAAREAARGEAARGGQVVWGQRTVPPLLILVPLLLIQHSPIAVKVKGVHVDTCITVKSLIAYPGNNNK